MEYCDYRKDLNSASETHLPNQQPNMSRSADDGLRCIMLCLYLFLSLLLSVRIAGFALTYPS